jgi:hypothetical protein
VIVYWTISLKYWLTSFEIPAMISSLRPDVLFLPGLQQKRIEDLSEKIQRKRRWSVFIKTGGTILQLLMITGLYTLSLLYRLN